ncbi:SCL-interrupting locus protein homolog [Euwallacea fornicatus]|uniref:SCL-interrupting locus protein homolog n=1 Tax=Euwallacea fornicatus TaxID=995702 RepID=UPI00338F16F3
MDSFYDLPRRPPAQISRQMLSGEPVVPEISLLCPSNVTSKNNFTPYEQWKHQQRTCDNDCLTENKENVPKNFPQTNSSILKKVRFEGPQLHTKTINNQVENNTNIRQIHLSKPTSTSPLISKTGPLNFEQMYMANIPNRQLDLSLIDLPKNEPKRPLKTEVSDKEEVAKEYVPSTYKEFLQSQNSHHEVALNDSVKDIFNYKGVGSEIQIAKSASLERKTFPFSEKCFQPYDQSDNKYMPKIDDQRPITVERNHIMHTQTLNSNPISPFVHPQMHRYNNYHDEARSNIKQEHQSEMKISPKPCDCCTDTCHSEIVKLKDNEDFSAKDLLKIIAQQSQQIAQQNSQLLLLQQQVTELVSMHKTGENQRTVQNGIRQGVINQNYDLSKKDNNGRNKVQERCVTSTQHNAGEFFNSPRGNKNFSIGLTTSLEVSFRRPVKNQNEFPERIAKVLDYKPEPLKIQEITETQSTQSESKDKDENNFKGTLVDTSLVFKEPIKVRETCPSPEPSIQIEMNAFEDSESEDDDTSQVEMTFYKNLMTQVNKILRKAQIQTAEEIAYNAGEANLNNQTMHKVKEAALKHLRKVGVDVPIDESSSSSKDSAGMCYSQDDVSIAVKQLLLKYLPAEHLAKLDQQQSSKNQQAGIKNRPEFSFATVQYMKKYNLIRNTLQNEKEFLKPLKHQSSKHSPKILDISKLKQQPKLL